MPNLRIIYRPSPSSRSGEYGFPLACSLYRGCTGGCKYCFAPATVRLDKAEFHESPRPREGALKKFASDLGDLAREGSRERVLLSFTTDPFQPLEAAYGLTTRALRLCHAYERPVAVLTKFGTAACEAFALLEKTSGWFGTSLVWDSERKREEWEHGTAPLASRCTAIAHAVSCGIYTWASVEPVIETAEALAAIQVLLTLGVQDIRVGLIEHHPEWREPGDRLLAFGRDLAAVMRDAPGTKWLVKKSLQPWMPWANARARSEVMQNHTPSSATEGRSALPGGALRQGMGKREEGPA